MPLMMIATTNGEAAAVVLALLASINFVELYGTSIPRRKTRTT
jgi:hypothetical protein